MEGDPRRTTKNERVHSARRAGCRSLARPLARGSGPSSSRQGSLLHLCRLSDVRYNVLFVKPQYSSVVRAQNLTLWCRFPKVVEVRRGRGFRSGKKKKVAFFRPPLYLRERERERDIVPSLASSSVEGTRERESFSR